MRCCDNRYCACAPLPEWERELLMTPRDIALRELNKAVAEARKWGLDVECVVTEKVVSHL